MKLRKKWLLSGAALVAAGMLLINPRLTNPPVEAGHDLLATNPPPAEIVSVLRGACYDCHSHETQWPWYSHVAPVSWWVAGHVNDGRKRLNFSNWPHDDSKRAVRWLDRISESVDSSEMPLPGYDRMHPAARLTRAQRDQLVQWAEQESARLGPKSDAKEKP
jgi:Haem-binding domain